MQIFEDERAIVRTLHRYVHSLDSGDLATFLDCFVEDGIWESTHFGLLGRGHAELASRFERHTHAPEALHKHMVLAPLIDVDGDVASAVSYFFFLQNSSTGPSVTHYGTYQDDLLRCPDGAWRFRIRVVHLEVMAPNAVSPLLADPESN